MFVSISTFAQAEVVDRIVAVVNNDIITQTELNVVMAPYLQKINSTNMPAEQRDRLVAQIRSDVLDQLIDKKLAEQQIRAQRIVVGDDMVSMTIERIKKDQNLTDAEFSQALAKDGWTISTYRGHLKEQMLRSQLIDRMVKSRIVITEQDIRRYYDANKEKGGSIYTIRNIVLPYRTPITAESRKEAETQMTTILQQLQNGILFELLARQYSVAENAVDGGKLGSIPFSSFVKPLQDLFQNVKPGEHAGPIDAGESLQLFYVESISQTQLDEYEKERQSIEGKLYEKALDERYKEWIDTVRKQAHVKINP